VSNKIVFTQARIRGLPLPEKGRKDYYDTKVPKLACRVSATGNKTYVVLVRFDGKINRFTIGKTEDIAVDQARDEAKKKLGQMASGKSPAKEKLKALTLKGALEHYIKNRHPRNGKELKPRTVSGYLDVMGRNFKEWESRSVTSITPDMVTKKYKSLTAIGTTTANVSMRVLRLTLKHAYSIGAVGSVATDVLVEKRSWHKNERKQRMIKAVELQSWFEAVATLKNERAKVYLLMLIFMGFRAGEALNIKWKDVSFKAKTVTIRDPKNRVDFIQPIPKHFMPYLVSLRDVTGSSNWVFSGENADKAMTVPKKPIAQVVKMTGIAFSSHDLRRTFATIAEGIGISNSIIKKLMNHTISENDVTGGYLITEDEVLSDNINRIAVFINNKVTEKGNVVRLHG